MILRPHLHPLCQDEEVSLQMCVVRWFEVRGDENDSRHEVEGRLASIEERPRLLISFTSFDVRIADK